MHEKPESTSRNRRVAANNGVLPQNVALQGARFRLLSAALQLFAQNGYSGTSVRAICSRAKIQATTLYAHFPSKEHVLAEIIRIGHEELYRRMQAGLLDVQPEPSQQLSALVRAHVLSHCEYAMLAVVANAEIHALSPAMSVPVMIPIRQAETLLEDVLERGVSLGAFCILDMLLAKRAIGGMGMRVAYWYSPECGRTPDQVADVYAEYAKRLVSARAVVESHSGDKGRA